MKSIGALLVVLLALLVVAPSFADEPGTSSPAASISETPDRFSVLVGSWSDDDRRIIIENVKPDGTIEGKWLGFVTELGGPAKPLFPGSRAYVDWRGKTRVKLRLGETLADEMEYELRDGILFTQYWGGTSPVRLKKGMGL